MRLDDVADRIGATGDALAGASTTMTLTDPGAAAFGGAAPGRLGELGRALHHQWSAALSARGREAAAHGARMAESADRLRRAARAYGEIDADIVERLRRDA